MRRLLAPSIALTIMGLAAGLAYRYLVDDPSEGSTANYLRSGAHGAGLALTGWAVHLYFSSHGGAWLRRWPLLVDIMVRAVVMAIAVATVAVALQVALYHHPLGAAWLMTGFPRIVAIALVLSVLAGAAFELTRLVGSRVLVNLLVGRYRRPQREERVSMFLTSSARHRSPRRWASYACTTFSPASSSTSISRSSRMEARSMPMSGTR
jgi:hypothetical protein